MALDPLSPIAPARIRALLVPVSRIKRSRFVAFVDLLRSEDIVRLGDISPDSRPDRNMFTPLAFPSGSLLYDFSTSLPSASQLALAPFEQFRDALLVIGIADAVEHSWLDSSRDQTGAGEGALADADQGDAKDISEAVEKLREQYPRAYLHGLVLFDCASQARHPRLPAEAILVPPAPQRRTTTLKTVVCDITSTLLAEMTTSARSMMALPTVYSPLSPQGGGPAESESLAGSAARRISQMPMSLRPGSPPEKLPRDMQRMSMPAHLPSGTPGTASQGGSRAPSPTIEGARTPPTTFDEMSGIHNAAPEQTGSKSKRPGTLETDRVSVHGFGSGGVGERARNKGRGRIGILIGTLYLCAGQWHDALRELAESAARARSFSDHLWHAKALENILVCLLLFAWSGMGFQIPAVCYPIAEKVKSPQHTPSSSEADVGAGTLSSHDAALHALNSLIPDLVNMILNVYTRAANFSGEAMPPLAFAECVVRFSRLLAVLNLSAGSLDNDALAHLVRGTPLRQKPRLSVPRVAINPTRHEICSVLFRALPSEATASTDDRVMVLAGMASVLSTLGLHRKRALVMKEFFSALIPGLVQARKVAAAEIGVHPAAGIAALDGNGPPKAATPTAEVGEERGVDELLRALGRVYGIPDTQSLHASVHPHGATGETSNGSAARDILRTSTLRSFGSLDLKLDVLRLCIRLCEALPDFAGVLHFTAALLRLAGPGTAPDANSTDVVVALSREEQTRLYTNFSRTVSATAQRGLDEVQTDYWDDFLVRGVHVVEEPLSLRLTHHRPSELETAASSKAGPFLHNPFLKKPDANAAERILVANDEYAFVAALQNPYEFEVEIESLRIAGDGVDFTACDRSLVLGPYRTQKFSVRGVARSSGTLTVNGCHVKIRGCRERFFPVFAEPWKPERDNKMKEIGLSRSLDLPSSRPGSASRSDAVEPASAAPQSASLSMTVIPEQPVAVVSDVSLPHSAVMVLEGETKKFTVTLHNASETTSIDFVHVSFQDSAALALRAATSNRDLPASELHELEVQLAQFPSLRLCNAVDDAVVLHPGKQMVLKMEVVGRARLSDAVVQFDYAHLSMKRSEVKERFFTRQLTVPISITVNASVQLQRPDVLPLSADFTWPDCAASGSPVLLSAKDTDLVERTISGKRNEPGPELCMLVLDLRNAWPNPLSVSLQVRSDTSRVDGDDDSLSAWHDASSTLEVIQPGHVNRIAVLLPRLHLPDPYAAVPSLNPASQRQFVVSASKTSPAAERAAREAFWFRAALLARIRGVWCDDAGGRSGVLDLRGIRLSALMVEALRLDDIGVALSVHDAARDSDNSDKNASKDGDDSGNGGVVTAQVHRLCFDVPLDTFVVLRAHLHNRGRAPVLPLLRLLPHLAGVPRATALDLDRRLAWSGVLQRRLPLLRAGASAVADLGLIALAPGVYEIGASVDEVQTCGEDDDGLDADGRGSAQPKQPRAPVLGVDVTADVGLRSWHVREPCTIVARNTENRT